MFHRLVGRNFFRLVLLRGPSCNLMLGRLPVMIEHVFCNGILGDQPVVKCAALQGRKIGRCNAYRRPTPSAVAARDEFRIRFGRGVIKSPITENPVAFGGSDRPSRTWLRRHWSGRPLLWLSSHLGSRVSIPIRQKDIPAFAANSTNSGCRLTVVASHERAENACRASCEPSPAAVASYAGGLAAKLSSVEDELP